MYKNYTLGSLEKMSDEHDPRNYQFATLKAPQPVPAECMNMKTFLESIDAYRIAQNYGSCTSAGNKRSKDWQEKVLMSQHFLYVMTKKISQIFDDEGDYPINAQKAIYTYGICEEKFMDSINPGRNWKEYATTEPSAEAYANALTHKSRTFWEIKRNSLSEIKRAIGGFQTPVSVAMEWRTSYYDCPASGHLPLPSGAYEGGHNVAGVGYTDAAGNLWLGNSWGKSWGRAGQCFIPYTEFEAHGITSIFVNLDITKNMTYKINKETGEQFLIDETLKLALNISNVAMLQRLQGRGLNEEPMDITAAELGNYLICPLTDRDSVASVIKEHYNELADTIGAEKIK